MIFENVKSFAAIRGVSIYRIEKDVELGNGTIAKWKTATPSSLSLKKVADYLEVSIDELMDSQKQEVSL